MKRPASLVLALLLAGCAAQEAPVATEPRTNLLFIITDDQRFEDRKSVV